MGKPGRWKHLSSAAEYIGRWRRTWGTETSQYLQEKKENSIPLVAASEAGRAQTMASQAVMGLWDQQQRDPGAQSNGMGRPAIAGDSPVDEA